jgi:hypothetical protein
MTLPVPPLMSFLDVSGTMAQGPMNRFLSLNIRQVHGNSSGLASPFFKLNKGLKFLVPHCFDPLELWIFSLHPCCQKTFRPPNSSIGVQERPKLWASCLEL